MMLSGDKEFQPWGQMDFCEKTVTLFSFHAPQIKERTNTLIPFLVV